MVPPFRKLGIAVAAGPNSSSVHARPYGADRVRIISDKYGSQELNEEGIMDIVNTYSELRKAERGYRAVRERAATRPLDSVFAVIGRITEKYGWRPMEVEISSSVPKGLGSSASVFVATAAAVLGHYGVNELTGIGDIANSGDEISHGRSSGIDAHTIAAGGWNSYRAGEGVKRLDVDFPVRMLAVDSGEPAKTMDTVEYFQELAKLWPENMKSLTDELERLVMDGLGAMKGRDMTALGQAMTAYYRELRRVDNMDVGIPKVTFLTQSLEKITEGALSCPGVLGAKPTGGWGGGCVLVLVRDEESVKEINERFRFYRVHDLQLGAPGVRLCGQSPDRP